ncbi:MAG: PAC2 family protein [Thermofilum sp.]
MPIREWSSYIRQEIPSDATLIVGMPDVGLVGPISTSHLIKSWELEHVGYLDSTGLPPVILFHNAEPLMPMRFYGGYKGNEYVLVLHSDVAVPPQGIRSLAFYLVKFSTEKKLKRILLLGGIAVQDRLNIETPKTYAASIDREMILYAKEKGIEPLKEGFVGGIYAQILKEGYKANFPALALLSECFLNYPDPGASASTLLALSKVIGREIDVKPLLEQEEEIRMRLREMMRRTLETMRGTGKEYEYTIPALYV